MNKLTPEFEAFSNLVSEFIKQEGPNPTDLQNVWSVRLTTPMGKSPIIDHPAIWIVTKGKKSIFMDGKRIDFHAGDLAVLLFPMALECEFMEVCEEAPFEMATIFINFRQIIDLLLKIDRIDEHVPTSAIDDTSGMFSISLNDDLLDALTRLFKVLKNPTEAKFLGESILEEIYFRLFYTERGSQIRFMLQQRNEIQRIAKAVDYIHQNIDQQISVENLAKIVHMSQTSFYENFKKILHLSPLQYAKSVKLDRAHTLIREGKKANEAGYLVGYNSTAQFSREYKRHFGFPPSKTV